MSAKQYRIVDNTNFFYLAEVVVWVFFPLKNDCPWCYGVLICRSELEAQRSWIILAKVSHSMTSRAKGSLALFHPMIILMYVLGNTPRKLSCGRASVWEVLSKWHSHFSYYLFSLWNNAFSFLVSRKACGVMYLYKYRQRTPRWLICA